MTANECEVSGVRNTISSGCSTVLYLEQLVGVIASSDINSIFHPCCTHGWIT